MTRDELRELKAEVQRLREEIQLKDTILLRIHSFMEKPRRTEEKTQEELKAQNEPNEVLHVNIEEVEDLFTEDLLKTPKAPSVSRRFVNFFTHLLVKKSKREQKKKAILVFTMGYDVKRN